MSRQVQFINRVMELEQIDAVIKEWGTRRVLCIHADGGIGKTRLLQEVRQRYDEGDDQIPLIVTDIIDLDNRTYHISQNVGRRIAQMMGEEKTFAPYLRGLLDYRKMKMAGVSVERVDREERVVEQTFVDCFNEVTTQRRAVLLWDTLDEELKDTSVWRYMLGLGRRLDNVVMLVAGRSAENFWDSLRPDLGEGAQLIALPPLEEEASKSYLREKQSLLHIALDPKLAQKVLLLARGRPILIDLAVEWRAREIPLDWLVNSKLQELEGLDDEAMTERQQEFEYQLVRHIADTRKPMDWLTLMMSRIYPLNVEMMAELLALTTDEAQALFEEAQTGVFVKTLPDGRISLHDEMRRMVNKYLWPDVDPDGDRRRRDSAMAADYLKCKVQSVDERISQIEKREEVAREHLDSKAELDVFVEREALERELWAIEGQRLHHTLLADLDKGVEAFTEIFDKATRSYRTAFRETTIVQMQQYADRLSIEQRYELDNRQARHLIDKGQYLQAKELITEVLAEQSSRPGQRLDMLTLLSNCNALLGNLLKATDQLEEALDICGEDPELARWEGKVLNTLGRVNRMLGRLWAASSYYERALHQVKDRTQIASILNDIGYVRSLQGHYRSALSYCEEALSVRKQLDLRREIGASLSTIGEIYRNWGEYERAMKYYNDALNIFEPENDPLWLARLHSYRGAIYRLESKFDLAETELRHSIALNVRVEQPWAHHVLGCVFWNRGDLNEALRLFAISDGLAHKTHDVRSQVNNLVGSAEIYYTQWAALGQKNTGLSRQIKEKAKELKSLLDQGYDFPHHLGRMKRVLADLAFEAKRYDEALEIYAEAYASLGGRLGGYGRRTFSDELDLLAQRIIRLAQEHPREAINWCQELRKRWVDESRPIMQRDTLVSMCDIRGVEIKLHLMKEDRPNE